MCGHRWITIIQTAPYQYRAFCVQCGDHIDYGTTPLSADVESVSLRWTPDYPDWKGSLQRTGYCREVCGNA